MASLNQLDTKRERLLDLLRSFDSCAVAFSAGVDSTVVAKAAQLALGDRAVAVTGVSASLADGELDEARRLADWIGIRHEIISTEEFANSNYTQNAPIAVITASPSCTRKSNSSRPVWASASLSNGANADDASDYRPGNQAAAEHRVRSPLLECGINKAEVRQLAADWGLPIWDKPAMPCLASRVAYGEEVTPGRLAMIDQAERLLRDRGLRTVRVRYHKGDLARLEVPADELGPLVEPATRQALVEGLKDLGFRFITLDLEGFRSGSLNTLVPLDILSAS